MRALKTARENMAQIAAGQRIQHALKSKIPPASRYVLKPGDLVRVYRGKYRRWIGPIEVVKLEGKSVFVSETKKVVKFNITQIIPINIGHAPEEEALEEIAILSEQVEKEQDQTRAAFYKSLRTVTLGQKAIKQRRRYAKKLWTFTLRGC